MEGQAVPRGDAARIHGKETGACNLGLDLGGDEIRLGSLVCKNLAQDLAPRRRPWLQWAWGAIRSAFDNSSGESHDRCHGTVVAGECDRPRPCVVAGKAAEVARVGPAKTVDRLIRIADRAQIRRPLRGREQAHQSVLGRIDVLIFVHQQMAAAAARENQRGLMGFQQADRATHQIVEIHCAGAGQRLFVRSVEDGQLGCCVGRCDESGLGRRDGLRRPGQR